MGKKKKKRVEEIKPWCFYCDRTFDDETILIQHQKARHFKCPTCNKRFTNAPGMAVHMQQVHKSTLETVPNALEGRDSHALEISGMRGIPMDHEAARKRMRMAGAFDDIQTKQGDVVQNLNQPQLPPGMLPPSIPGFHVPPGMPSAPIGMPPFGLPPMMGMPPPISFQQNSVATSVTGPKVAQVGGSMVGDTPDVENIIHDLEGLIYRDEMISMEEKRAKLPKSV